MDLPCLPLIQERFFNAIKEDLKSENVRYPEFEVTVFSQGWGSTSLGFGGIGGQAMTDAYTTVIQEQRIGWVGVFFGECLAYVIKNPAQTFFEDLQKQNMASCNKQSKYIRKQ